MIVGIILFTYVYFTYKSLMIVYQIQFWYSVHFLALSWFVHNFCLKQLLPSKKLIKNKPLGVVFTEGLIVCYISFFYGFFIPSASTVTRL